MHWIIRNIIISSLLAIGIYTFIFFSETGNWPVINDQWAGMLIAVVMVNVGGIVLYYLNKRFGTLLPWNRNISIRFLAEVSAGILTFTILGLIYIYFYVEQFAVVGENNTFWEQYWDGIVKYGVISLVLIYIFSLVNFSIYSYNQYSVAQIETLSIDRDQLNLQFEALKSQLSPHFLFNALNTISSLIYKDVKLAEKYVRKLAETYQYILKTDDKRLVKLEDELKMVKAFYFMQRIKYEDCIHLEDNLSEELLGSLVPPLTLQMLIENALKHNLICDEVILKLEIYEENGKFICVRNNIIQKPELLKIGNNLINRPAGNESYNIGLSNIKSRYLYFTNKEISVKFDDFFTVKLPVISDTN